MNRSRRAFLSLLTAGTGAAAAAATLPRPAQAGSICMPPNMFNGVQLCEVAASHNRPIQKQQNMYWCWAACIADIFECHGYAVRQKEIVEKIHGIPLDLPAVGPQIMAAINGRWEDLRGNRFKARMQLLWDRHALFGNPRASQIAIRELEQDKPLITGALGHATVLTGMSYARDGWGNVQPMTLVVKDPFPNMPSIRTLHPAEIVNTTFLAAVDVY